MIQVPQTDAEPTAMQLALIAAVQAADAKPVRPAVPGKAEQRLDTDYDPDPALEQTPLKNSKLKLKPRKR